MKPHEWFYYRPQTGSRQPERSGIIMEEESQVMSLLLSFDEEKEDVT